MTVWMIKSSTGQYQGKVFASEELAKNYHNTFKEWREVNGFYSSVVPVVVIEE